MGILRARQREQALAHPAIDLDECLIARAPVVQHRLLGAHRRCQWTRGQEIRVAFSILHGMNLPNWLGGVTIRAWHT
jgi:hypothetical protein